MPQNAFFLRTRDLLVSQKMTQRHFLSTLHPLSTVIFATATALAFVLRRDSRFNFHCYTQRKATPTQKSARKCAATSCAKDYKAHSLGQSSFAESPNIHSVYIHMIMVASTCLFRTSFTLSMNCFTRRASSLLAQWPPSFIADPTITA